MLSIILLYGCTTVYLSKVIGFWFAKSPIPHSQVMWFGDVWPNPTSRGIHPKTWSISIFHHPDQRDEFRGGHMAQFHWLIVNVRQLKKLLVTRRYWTETMKRDAELVSLVTILPLQGSSQPDDKANESKVQPSGWGEFIHGVWAQGSRPA